MVVICNRSAQKSPLFCHLLLQPGALELFRCVRPEKSLYLSVSYAKWGGGCSSLFFGPQGCTSTHRSSTFNSPKVYQLMCSDVELKIFAF